MESALVEFLLVPGFNMEISEQKCYTIYNKLYELKYVGKARI